MFNKRLKDDKSDIYSAVAQIASDLTYSKHSPKVAVLTTYNKTWICQLFKNQDKNAYKLLISPMITRENFLEAVYFVCSLLFEEIRNSIARWSDYVTNNMLKADETADIAILKRPGSNGSNNQSNTTSLKRLQPSKKTSEQFTTVEADLDKSGDTSGVDTNDAWQDFLFDSEISEWNVIGYGYYGYLWSSLPCINKNDYKSFFK